MDDVHDDVIGAIGNTPIVRLNRLKPDTGAALYAKLEFMNPGSSIKDRIALQMVLDAEDQGLLKPGGSIVECTSGNTGMGLALVGAVRGYRTIFVMPDKVSGEKIKALRAFGARVITTPTAVAPDDPRSYYSVARRISQETPNCFFANQYHNMSNPLAHERTTGPEIWRQMGESLDAVVIASGTGGTISGIGRVLKARKPSVKMICIDPVGSIFYDYWRTGKVPDLFKTYKVEGFGEDFLPATIDFRLVDEVVQVSDRECFLTARELTRKEGLFTGGSGGGAVAGALKWARAHPEARTILVILPDSGSRYLSKVYDDHWLKENSFLDDDARHGTVRDLLERRGRPPLVSAEATAGVQEIVALMKRHGISQVPIMDGPRLVGMITEVRLLKTMLDDPASVDRPVRELAESSYALVAPDTPVARLSAIFAEGSVAVVQEDGRVTAVITKIDLIDHLAGAQG
ncbi:MAG TPA: pyridoxal-phosphate dependent enzyme [Candidatus Polarisedimenticolia bacterium]|nr:pyridoxal-phosphate dependent enzyme [Candidatus Polarisedimenticolia bacterium]